MNATVEQLRTQANEFLTYVSTEVVGQVLGADLPLIGNSLLNPLLAPGANTLLGGLRQTINQALDQVDGAGATLAQNIATKLDGLDGVAASATGTLVTIDIAAGDSLSNLKAQGLDIDIGWDALGLELTGDVKAGMAFDVDARLTFDVATGELRLFDTADKLATVTLKGALNGSGAGKLGFIGITAVDQFAGDELSVTGTVDYHPAGGSILVTDLADASADDFQLTLKGAAQANLGLTVDLATDLLPKITTDLLGQFAFDYDSANDDGFLTTTSLDLANITLDVGSIVGLLGEVFGPIVDNVFGAFPIKQLLGTLTTPLPLIDAGIKKLELFDDFNIIKDENINLLDLAGAYLIANGASTETINTFARAYSLINAIAGLQAAEETSSLIQFGGYHIYGPVLPAMAVLPEGTAQSIMALGAGDPLDTLGEAIDEAGGPPSPGEGLGNPAGFLSDILKGSGLELPILKLETIVALLTAGENTTPIDLITYDIPPLTFDANFHKFFPVIGPIGVAFDGGFGAKLDVDIGYDSRGLTKPGGSIADGFYFTTALDESQTPPAYLPAGHVEAGVFASAAVNVGIGEAGVGGGIVAELNAYLDTSLSPQNNKLYLTDLLSGEPCIFDPVSGEFSVRVRAYVTVGVEPFAYTKRFDLVKKTLADFSFGCPPPVPTDDLGLATIKGQANVAYINAGDRAESRAINGIKGSDGKLRADADEYFFVEQRENGSLLITAFGLSDINGHPKKGGAGDDDIPPTRIIANMGNGDDQMVLEDHVVTPAQMTGGDGDDLLGGGLGEDTLDGGANSDRLIGGGAKDTLIGGDGDDYLEGGAGGDTLNGGVGTDQVTYENSNVGVIFNPNGKQGGYVGTGGDAEGDTLISIEQITGSHYDDQLIGNQKQGSLLEGLDGIDVLQGGAADDLLIGGGRGDTLNGGGGNDTISYLTSAGQVTVSLALGFGFGGDATGDGYSSIENVQGTAGNDGLYGNGAGNILMGWYGDDRLAGGAGFDTIYAGGGSDTVFALGDGDQLDGDGETKSIRGNYFSPGRDLLTYEDAAKGITAALAVYKVDDDTGDVLAVSAGYGYYTKQLFRDRIAVNVVKDGDTVLGNSTFEDLTGSRFKDDLTGDYQNNVIRGLAGNDKIDGSNGDDTLIGGAGADTLTGGDGRDLADYRGSILGVTVTLANTGFGTGTGGDAEGDLLEGIENLRGSGRGDQLTGNGFNNRIDPGLSRFDGKADTVNGGAGYDTLVLDWSLSDSGKGMIGGYANVPATQVATNGAFARQQAKSTDLLDSVTFSNIERIEVIGTSKGDVINGGAGSDTIDAGDGNDAILTGIGFAWLDPNDQSKGYDYLKGGINYDYVSGGAGNDVIAVNTGSDGNLSLFGGTRFGLIDGGAGIDILNASFTVARSDIILLGKQGTSEFRGKNYASPDGSAITDMEVLGIVATGFGDDILVQPGRYANVFATGFGRDLIDAGLGKDVVDGGLDFVYDDEVVVSDSDPKRLEITTLDFAQVFLSDGDHLDVDYSNGTAAITSSVSVVDTGFTLARPGDSTALRIETNNGFFQSGKDRVDFSNIENVFVIGTKFGDQIFGTNLTYGVNRRAGEGNALLASASARGDDILTGNAGNDVIFAGTGDDLVRGGDGDDVLLGTAFPTSRTLGPVDLGEVDQLEGGAGRDVFLLGTTVVLYNDQASEAQTSHRRVSSDNRAELRDFNAQFDTIVLSALPTNGTNRRPYTAYDAVAQDGDTYIYLKDGVATPGNSAASHNELIAIVRGVTDVNLVSKYVLFMQPDGSYVYGNGAAATPPPVLTPASAGLAPAEAARGAPAIADHASAFAQADVTAALPHADAAAAADTAGWVKQTGDADVLRAALFKGNTVLGAGTLTVQGNSAAVGIFQGDPFGLGSGVVLSTGRVLDLPGVNTIDGGRGEAAQANLKFELAGIVRGEVEGQFSRIYRANLSDLGFDLNSIKLGDASGGFGGAGGEFSGFDIDAVALSTELRTFSLLDADVFNNTMTRIDAFDFDLGSVKYVPGNLRAPVLPDTELRGQQNGLPMFDAVTLDRADGDFSAAGRRALTLGEGGSIGFDLSQTVSTKGPLYLYVAEAGTAGETLTTGLTASVDRLETPADLSTDLGRPGIDGDTTTLTYTFRPRITDGSRPNTIAFDVVLFSEEFAEFAEKGFNDKFKVTLNGVELARLSDGSFASIDTLYTANAGPSARTSIYELRQDVSSSDLIYNPVGTGPAADRTHADGFSKVLHLVGNIDPTGLNTLTIEVSDEGDAYLDSGILIRGGSFVTDTTGRFTIERGDRVVREGESRTVAFGLDVPEGARLTDPVTVLFTPPDDVDLGNGAGRAYSVVLDPGEVSGQITYTVLPDRVIGNSRFETIGVAVRGLPGTETVAPLVINIDDQSIERGYRVGNAPTTYDRADPGAWERFWSYDGLTITHSPDGRAAYSTVNFGIASPDTLAGSDMLAGDLGVSGTAGTRTPNPQELGGTERLKFTWASQDVDAVTLHFNLLDRGDVAVAEFYDAAGRLLDTRRTGETTLAVEGLDNVASMVVSAAAGSFVIDALDVHETVVRARGSVSPSAFVADDIDVRITEWDMMHGRWSMGEWLERVDLI